MQDLMLQCSKACTALWLCTLIKLIWYCEIETIFPMALSVEIVEREWSLSHSMHMSTLPTSFQTTADAMTLGTGLTTVGLGTLTILKPEHV